MGHVFSPRYPKGAKWKEVVALITFGAGIPQLANATARAAADGFRLAGLDPVLRKAVWLLARFPPDSLAGAALLIAEWKQPLLITHRPTEKLAGRQARLTDGLRDLAGQRPPVHLTVKVNKDSDLTRENSQRSRSFLYAALGGLIAATAEKDRLLMFENGVLSVHLPPSGAVVGSRATRTTHPKVLAGFSQLLSHAIARPFTVVNPFHDHTKTEVIQTLVNAGGRDLIRWSTSCVHTHQMSEMFPHCGQCSQCVDRRFAILAAGEADADPGERYRVDLITGDRSNEEAGALAGYVEQAIAIHDLPSPAGFFSRYGEVLRALRGIEAAPVAAERVYELYRRHARQVVGVVDDTLRAQAAAIRSRTLPANSLPRLVYGEPPVVQSADQPTPQYLFARQGEGWRIRFDGGQEIIVFDQIGLSYLQRILTHPGQTFKVTDFGGDRVQTSTKETATDRQALHELYVRLQEATEDRERARTRNDPASVLEAEEELEAIEKQIRKDTKPGGRLRSAGGEREKHRKAVCNAITRACKKIGEFDKKLAEHLKKPLLTLGQTILYQPPAGIVWMTGDEAP